MNPYILLILYLSSFVFIKTAPETKEYEIGDVLFNIKTEDSYFKKLNFTNVVEYTDDNYISRIKNDKPLLMYIYAPYMPECQQTVEIFLSMANFIKNNKKDLNMAKVNVHDNKEFAKDYKIDDVPKLLFIGRNRKVLEYKQEITYYNLLRFINKKLYGNALEFEKLEEVNATVADPKYKKNQVFVLYTLVFEFKQEVFNN